jgi:hypothetical protein
VAFSEHCVSRYLAAGIGATIRFQRPGPAYSLSSDFDYNLLWKRSYKTEASMRYEGRVRIRSGITVLDLSHPGALVGNRARQLGIASGTGQWAFGVY